MWTALSCVLCLFCAKNPQNRSIYSELDCCCLAACSLWVAAEAGRPLIMPIRLTVPPLQASLWPHLCWR